MNPKQNDARKQALVEPRLSTVYPEVFHYTTIAALKGMLGSNTLWATQASHLNDSSEMTILWPYLEHQCVAYINKFADEYLGKHPETKEEFETLGGVAKLANTDGGMIISVMRELLFGSETKAGMGIPFIVSFTTHDEEYNRRHGMLSQWRGYGGGDNVAISFATEGLERLLQRELNQFQYLTCSIADVIYCREEVNFVERFPQLFDALEQFSQLIVGGWGDNDELLQEMLAVLSAGLLPAAGRVKHPAFHEEKECRIIAGIPDESYLDRFVEFGGAEVHMKKVHFRNGVDGSIPFIKLFEDLDERLPISRILVGPSRNQQANEQAVYQAVCEHAGRETIRIDCSDMPFVGSI